MLRPPIRKSGPDVLYIHCYCINFYSAVLANPMRRLPKSKIVWYAPKKTFPRILHRAENQLYCRKWRFLYRISKTYQTGPCGGGTSNAANALMQVVAYLFSIFTVYCTNNQMRCNCHFILWELNQELLVTS